MKYNTKHGQGTFKTKDGVTYTGAWKWNKRHGTGVLTTSSWKYEGEFEDDLQQGHGIL